MAQCVALVTGGSRGIGLGIARCLVTEGYQLAINGVREESAAAESLDALRQLGASVVYARGDVGDENDRQKIVDTVREAYGRIDLLVNNAGVAPKERADILDAGSESFDRLMRINLRGPYFLTQSIAKWMVELHGEDSDYRGCIVNVSSVSATVASVNRGDYCISKAGVAMATKLWAARLAEYGIDVYEVQPGIIKTDMTAGVKQKYDDLIAGGLTVEKRWGRPEDVGRVVAAMARGDLPYATGQVVVVDGGLTLPRL